MEREKKNSQWEYPKLIMMQKSDLKQLTGTKVGKNVLSEGPKVGSLVGKYVGIYVGIYCNKKSIDEPSVSIKHKESNQVMLTVVMTNRRNVLKDETIHED